MAPARTAAAAIGSQPGPTVSAYTRTTVTPAAIHFAHRSRRLTIRTPSQTQKAAKATARIGRRMAMPAILSGMTRGREDRVAEAGEFLTVTAAVDDELCVKSGRVQESAEQ